MPGVLTLRFTTNSGGAFSIGQSAPWFFVGVTAVVVAIILATSFRHTSRTVGAALGLVLGGALGNLTDRAVPGSRASGDASWTSSTSTSGRSSISPTPRS